MLVFLTLLCSQQSYSVDFNALMEWKREILKDTAAVYEPHAIESFGKPLEITVSPKSIVSASADHLHTHLKIIVNQGLLASPRLTPDSLRIIICHELGHLFGGAPRRNVPVGWDGPVAQDGLSYFSSEGQADYYATAVCFRKLVEQAEGTSAIKSPQMERVGPELRRKCSKEKGKALSASELNLCYRAALGGLDFLTLGFDFPISCEHEDQSVAKKLVRDFYPNRQCRLDTMIRGAHCKEELPHTLSFNNMNKNECKNPEALRPPCWFISNDNAYF